MILGLHCAVSCYIASVTSSGGPAVLVDEASEAIVAHQLAARNRPRLGGRAGQLLLKPLMRSSAMVVLEERGQYPLQMSSSKDQEVIQALPPCCADEPLGDGVRPRGADGEAHDSHALSTELLVECGGELGVTIPEKELGRESTVLETPGQIASLLHHPLRARVVSAAGEVNATAADLNKEEDVELGHPDGV